MSENKLCPNCETEREFRLEKRCEEYTVRGYVTTHDVQVEVCVSCGEALFDECRDQKLIENAFAAYRRAKGLLLPDDIHSIRTRFGLSQAAFANLLGMSQATLNRYEGGGLQDDAHDELIRSHATPVSMADLLARKGDRLTRKQRKKVDRALASISVPTQDDIPSLYRKLSRIGLNRRFVETVLLPDWWEDASAERAEDLLGLVASRLGIDGGTLHNPIPSLIAPGEPCRFKLRKGTEESDMLLPSRLSMRAATLASQAVPVESPGIPMSASEIREAILADDHRWVTLDNLLDYCWSRAVPVLHIPKFPAGCRKMDGMVTSVGQRPVVIISSNRAHSAILLFILAHELGHVACEHVQSGTLLLDETVERQSSDDEEQQANRFAVELLTGASDTEYHPTGAALTAKRLSHEAVRVGETDKVDPGVVAMNYAWGQEFFAVGVAALNLIEPDADAPGTIRRKAMDYLVWDELDQEDAAFLARLMGTT